MELQCNRCGYLGEPRVEYNGPHKTAYCSMCGKFIKHLPQNNPKICDICKKSVNKIYRWKNGDMVCGTCYGKLTEGRL